MSPWTQQIIVVHVRPELSADDRAKLEKAVIANTGVIAADFDHHKHELMVVYDAATTCEAILDVVRQTDPVATMIGL